MSEKMVPIEFSTIFFFLVHIYFLFAIEWSFTLNKCFLSPNLPRVHVVLKIWLGTSYPLMQYINSSPWPLIRKIVSSVRSLIREIFSSTSMVMEKITFNLHCPRSLAIIKIFQFFLSMLLFEWMFFCSASPFNRKVYFFEYV